LSAILAASGEPLFNLSQSSHITMLLYPTETLQPAETTASPELAEIANATDYI